MPPKNAANKQDQSETKSPLSGRNVLVLGAEGFTGQAIMDLFYGEMDFKSKVASVRAVVFHDGASETYKEMGIDVTAFSEKLSFDGVDTCLIIPPANKDKAKITRGVIDQAKAAKGVTNLVFLSSVGCDYATKEKQPHLREFIDLEVAAMAAKQDSSTEDTGHSTCVVRAGFYAENLLLYSKQSQGEGKLPLPIDPDHKFAPVSLGDVALLVVSILTSEGPHGLGDMVRGQLITLTGPLLTAGPELAQAASQALSSKLEFVSVKENEAKKLLNSHQGDDIDDAEKAYLMEYYSLVREGKTGYISTQGYQQITGQAPTELTDFFQAYEGEFKPKKKRRIAKKGGD